jgi:hypothetical protein
MTRLEKVCQAINKENPKEGSRCPMPLNDQRTTERFNCEAPVVIEDFQTGERHDGSMYNYSRGGMYIELDYPLKPGSKVRILIENGKNVVRSESCLAKTIWCKEIPGAVVLYDYGIGLRYDLDVNGSNYINKFHVINGGANNNNT